MRRVMFVGVLSLALVPSVGLGQIPLGEDAPPIYRAPGYYGTVFGTPSYGTVRTWSAFASPFGGVGYGYGYPPSVILPGPWGAGLWSQGPNGTGADVGFPPSGGAYRTFPAIPVPEYPGYRPGFGYYAPAIGPPSRPPVFGR